MAFNCSLEGTPEFEAAANASQALVAWTAQPKYANYTTYFIVVVIFLRILLRAYYMLVDRCKLPLGLDRPAALLRSISYRRLPIIRFGMSPSLGTNLILGAGALYMMLWCFVPHPWYRECRNFGSPPLAVRAGLMSNALTPLIYAFGGKVNVVTFLTGVSYDKLNVFHRSFGWLALFFALVHTIPFLYQAFHENGIKLMSELWDAEYSLYVSGVVALVALVILCFCSLTYIRKKHYEIFLHVHWPTGLAYMGLMFWHAEDMLYAWAFLWASVAFLLVGYIYRYLYKTNYLQLRNNWFVTDPALCQPVMDESLEITIYSNTIFSWKPGQHFFLRFPSIHPLASHPFSVATSSLADVSGPSKMKFVIRPKNGTTATLYQQALTKKEGEVLETSVLIDGPYGGLDNRSLQSFDTVVLVGGGSGVTPLMSFLHELSINPGSVKKIIFVWAIRNIEAYEWFRNEIDRLISLESVPVDATIYVTASSQTPGSVDEKQTDIKTDSLEEVQFTNGRPSIHKILSQASASFGSRTLVVSSGPSNMNCDVGNSVAKLQSLVITGKLKEIYLHTETFGW